MGLDTVEIVLRVEETFGVDLPDDELGSVSTVGDLYKLLLSRLDGSYAFCPVRRLIAPVPTAGGLAKTVLTNNDAVIAQGAASRRSVTMWKCGRF